MVTEAEVRERLERLVAASTSPTLGAGEISALLRGAVRPDSAGRLYTDDVAWTANAALAVGDRVVPASRTGSVFVVTASDGAAGATEPDWPATGSVTLDGVTYELAADAPAAWRPTYDLAAAVAEGWRMKAGLVSDRFRFADDGDTYDRDQIFAHCVRMAEHYEAKAAAGGLLVGSPAGGARGASMMTLERSDRAAGLDEDRLIRLERWDGTGAVPRVN